MIPGMSLWRHPDFLRLWAGQTVPGVRRLRRVADAMPAAAG